MGFLRSALSAVGSLVPQGEGDDKAAHLSVETVGEAPDGTPLIQYTLAHPNGLQARFLNHGATLTALVLPDGTNVVARLPRPEDYLSDHPYIGSTIGPVANRLWRGEVRVGDAVHRVQPNENGNLLHSGPMGYHAQVWEGAAVGPPNAPTLRLSLFSRDSARGFASDTWAFVDVELLAQTLVMRFSAFVSRPSFLNMTTHAYFNPTGDFASPVDGLTLWCPGAGLPVNAQGLIDPHHPDRTAPDLSGHGALGAAAIDNHYRVDGAGQLRLLATLTDHERYVFVHSDAPGLQIYTADTVAGVPTLAPRGAVALEPQSAPGQFREHPGDVSAIAPGRADFGAPWRRTIAYRLAGPGLPELPSRGLSL